MTPRERAEASVLVRQQGPRVVDVQSDTNIVLMRSYSVLDAEVRAGWLRDMVERAIIADRAEQAAGEAERVREAVAREREACARECWDFSDELAGETGFESECGTLQACAARIRARATSPAPEPVAAERAVVETALAAIDEHLRGQFMRTTDGQMVRGYLPDGDGGTSKRYLDADDCRALAGAFGVVADTLAAARKGGGT